MGKVGPRSYLVDIDGRIVRRNRRVIREAKDPVPPIYLMSMINLPEAPSSHRESEQLVCHQPVVDQPVLASKSQNEKLFGVILKINVIKRKEKYAYLSESSKMCNLGRILIFIEEFACGYVK